MYYNEAVICFKPRKDDIMADKKKGFPLKVTKKYIDLLYMTSNVVSAKDIADLFITGTSLTIELWEEMNVLEFVLPNQNTVDFEAIDPNFKDPSDLAFVKNRGIQTIFAINLCEEDLPTMTEYFNQLVEQFTGFVCADSEDFTPVYAGSSKK
jgi:hypothetical protein